MTMKNCGNCGNCAHWGKPDETNPTIFHKTCTAIPHDERGCCAWDEDDRAWRFDTSDPDGICESAEEIAKAKALIASLAVAHDCDGYYACLTTRAEFCCVLHKPKGTADGQ